MRDTNRCQYQSLPPALSKLLETCIVIRTTNTKILAAYLCRSPATIRTQFQRIFVLMNVHCRYEALRKAEEQGWVRCGCRQSGLGGYDGTNRHDRIK